MSPRFDDVTEGVLVDDADDCNEALSRCSDGVDLEAPDLDD